jgi:2-polyprenyl-6-methoxyphenol hydroxylase-like FAD-dependent oxidoreductase
MRETDIVIVGGGLAGSTAAAMLGRAGYRVMLVDPRPAYPPDFRCEKLDASQVHLLRRTGLADGVLQSATLNEEVWVARFGRLVEKRRTVQYGIAYQALVNAVRGQIPAAVAIVHDKATAIATSADRQTITLSGGDEISARLVILANGLNDGLRRTLGMASRELSACHSVSLGFDVRPLGRPAFAFPALTYHPAHPGDRIAYLTLFPIGNAMRANLFVYRSLRDPWLRDVRDAPEAALLAALPGLDGLMGAFTVDGAIKVRPVDLSATADCRDAGVVLVGDAFATSCPAAGTGLNKVFTDVERLCAVHIPRWFRTGGMGRDKIAAFYDDPVKTACDTHSLRKARHLRALSTEISIPWRVRRWGRSLGHVGAIAVRRTRQRLPMRAPERRREPFAPPAKPRD